MPVDAVAKFITRIYISFVAVDTSCALVAGNCVFAARDY